ncbi:polycystin-2-like protein 2 [Melanerpes formicivorus]|uniref:polycystin-2-like protein 2 n=1 Tax=Melanerpes formicivorus TaxID=211600 RepID=UPI00358E1B0B
MKRRHSRKLVPKTTQRELAIYIVFLIALCTLTLGMVSSDMYYLHKVMSQVFVEPSSSDGNRTSFRSIGSKDDFWRFAEGPLLDGLYWDKWYTNRTLPLQHNSSHIYYENLLLGAAQIRQLKVHHNSCSIHPSFRVLLDGCYSKYHYGAEDSSDFGPGNTPEWKYSSASSSLWYWGAVAVYSSGGYKVTLPRSKQGSLKKLEFLRQHSWLTRGTRVVFIDFSTYNANVNLFCIIRLVVEFPASGGALTSSHFYSVKLLRYITYYDYFLASCEISCCLLVFMFIIQEAGKITNLKGKYFRSAWNWLDLLLVVLSVLAIAFNIYRTGQVSLLLEELLSDPHLYPDFYFLAFCQVLYNNTIAVTLFLAWIKILKYINFNKTMAQLSCTLARCAKGILGFSIIFFIIFFAYAQFGYLVFGSQAEEFSTFQNSIFTQFRMVLGDLKFETIEAADRILGPFYFITFVFFVFFVLLSMFLAIISDTYAAVRAEFAVMPRQEFQMKELFRQALVKLKLRKPEKAASATEENWARTRKEFSASDGDSDTEKKPSKVQEIEERLGQLHPPARDVDAVAAQGSVSSAEFLMLLTHISELQGECNKMKAKFQRALKNIKLQQQRKQPW